MQEPDDLQMIGPAASNDRTSFARPSALRMFRTWAAIGAQSFGGGAATLYLIRRVAVEREHWLTDSEFVHFWGICQITPGINILGLVILIGWRVCGARGVVLALAGLLLPSAAITVLLTSVYAGIRQEPLVHAAISGIVPATVGLGLLLVYGMSRPMLEAANKEGRRSLLMAALILGGSALAAILGSVPVLAILWGSGAILAVERGLSQRGSR